MVEVFDGKGGPIPGRLLNEWSGWCCFLMGAVAADCGDDFASHDEAVDDEAGGNAGGEAE